MLKGRGPVGSKMQLDGRCGIVLQRTIDIYSVTKGRKGFEKDLPKVGVNVFF